MKRARISDFYTKLMQFEKLLTFIGTELENIHKMMVVFLSLLTMAFN